MDLANLIQAIAIYAIPVLFAITVHEAAHGYVARYLGDNTAWTLGRVTLNPFKHIDPVGTILMPLLLLFATSGAFLFGYAKPVPVNFGKLRKPKRDMVWVALARSCLQLHPGGALGIGFICGAGRAGRAGAFFLEVCKAGMLVNFVMWAFNLFPLPPLDGGRILVGLLPFRAAQAVSRVEPWGFFIVLASCCWASSVFTGCGR